jgi:hypothetical protein
MRTDAEKRHARQDKAHFERFCNLAAGSLFAIELFQQSTSPGVPDTYTAVTLGAIGLLGVLGNDRKIVSQGIADDPPRGDFRYVTRLRPVAIRAELLGSSPTAVAAASASQSLFLGNIRLEASLRAAERALGAKEAEDFDAMRAREREAEHWGYRAGERYREFGSSARDLARLLISEDQERPIRLRPEQRVERRRTTFEELFDVWMLALLYRVGIPIRNLREEVEIVKPGRSPTLGFSRALEQTANDSDLYAKYLISGGSADALWLED